MKRIEVVTSVERHRRFTNAEKERIVIESMAPRAIGAGTARKNEIAPSLIYTWRKTHAPAPSKDIKESLLDLVPASSAFVRAVAARDVTSREPIMLHIYEQMLIEFPAGADIAAISALITSIRE